MELEQEYIHRTDDTPRIGVVAAKEAPDWLGFLGKTWHWFNFGASKLMILMSILVAIAILDYSHNNILITMFFSLILCSIVIWEIGTTLKAAWAMLKNAGLLSHSALSEENVSSVRENTKRLKSSAPHQILRVSE